MDCSPPGSSVHGILQARIVEWVAIFSSRGSSQGLNPRLLQVNSLPLVTWEAPCLANPVDRGAWRAIVHGAAKEWDMTKRLKTQHTMGTYLQHRLPGWFGSVVKNSPASTEGTGNVGLIPKLGRFCWRRKWQLALVFLPRESYGQRSLVLESVQRITKSQTQLG